LRGNGFLFPGDHVYLTTQAGAIIEKESPDILSRLKRAE
jgi:hypothetical protein